LGAVLLIGSVASLTHADRPSFIGRFNTVSKGVSTVPANGDINPYGVAVVPRTTGKLVRGDVLVSNFNNAANAQGTGSTIVEIAPDGSVGLFAQINAGQLPGSCPGGVGLTTALVVLRSGWVIVGSLPTSDGMSDTAQAGCLIVLDSEGGVAETISGDPINGPWDMTAFDADDRAVLFVSNVLNGTVAAGGSPVNGGTVVRIVLSVPDHGMPTALSRTVIASGFGEVTDPNALVIGPTGLGLGPGHTLYVADTLASRIAAIPDAMHRSDSAGTGHTVSEGGALNGPLGLAISPNNDIITVNAGDGNMVETTRGGSQIDVKLVDDTGIGGGTLFGLAVAPGNQGVFFVNDGDNSLRILH
jgi:hypothetical protein